MEIYLFQHMQIKNATLQKNPLLEAKVHNEENMSTVFIRDPYDYFDAMLFEYLKERKSLLFTDDIIKRMETEDGIAFLKWLNTLTFLPFYNPQTFFVDARKRVDTALENLENFDYVVPYEESELFLDKVANEIQIEKESYPKLKFSIKNHKEHPLVKVFLEKDLLIYGKTLELWNKVKENDFKPLGEIIKRKTIYTALKEAIGFKGACGNIEAKMIQGFALYKNAEKPLTLEIYNNQELIATTVADVPRPELQQQLKLSKEHCGFKIIFEEETFRKGDKVEVIIVPENIKLPIVGNAQAFLG
jgi:hypothetical protein